MPEKRSPRWLRAAVFALLFLLLFLSARFGLTNKNNYTMDPYSNELVICDMLHDVLYPGSERGNWMQFVYELHEQGYPKGYVTEVFETGGSIPESAFVEYYSQLGLHSKVYSLLARALPISPRLLLQGLYTLNALLYAAMLTVVLWWLSRIVSLPAAVVVGLQAALLSPRLQGYGMNLYWAGWSLFLPMAGMALLTQSRAFAGKRARLWSFGVAFAACLCKLAIYNEYVSAVMVAMMIPWFYVQFAARAPLRQVLREVWFPVLGALAAFVLACGVRLAHIQRTVGDLGEAWRLFMDRINLRVGGVLTEAATGRALEAVYATVWETIWLQLTDKLFQVGPVSVNALGLAVVFAVFAVAGLLTARRMPEPDARSLNALLAATALSALAPLSWYVLAKPHTYVHVSQCLVLWYVPFLLLATAYVARLLGRWTALARGKAA